MSIEALKQRVSNKLNVSRHYLNNILSLDNDDLAYQIDTLESMVKDWRASQTTFILLDLCYREAERRISMTCEKQRWLDHRAAQTAEPTP